MTAAPVALRCSRMRRSSLPDHQGSVQAAAPANDGDGGKLAEDGGPGLGGALLYHLVPTSEVN